MSEVIGYHAHVYFDPSTRPVAERVRNAIAGKFTVELGGFSDEPRGPHPVSQFNVIFQAPEFQSIVPWLMFNREGLDVLVHPLTEDMVDDHSIHALWLGTPVKLKLDTLRNRSYRAELLPSEAAHPV
jgi:aromatic ring-cleaving dioxygenase